MIPAFILAWLLHLLSAGGTVTSSSVEVEGSCTPPAWVVAQSPLEILDWYQRNGCTPP